LLSVVMCPDTSRCRAEPVTLPVHGLGSRTRRMTGSHIRESPVYSPDRWASRPFRWKQRRFAGRNLALPSASCLRVAKQGTVSWSRRAQTPGLMRLNFPETAVCFFGYRPWRPCGPDYTEEKPVGTHIGVPPAGHTWFTLRLPNPPVSDWSNGSPVWLRPELGRGFPWRLGLPSGSGIARLVGDLRRTWSTSRFPLALENHLDLRFRPGGVSPLFRPERACRRKSTDMDCRVSARIPFLGI